MKVKPVVPRELANQDVDGALAYYLGEQAEAAALGFIDALQEAYPALAATWLRARRVMHTNSTCRGCADGR